MNNYGELTYLEAIDICKKFHHKILVCATLSNKKIPPQNPNTQKLWGLNLKVLADGVVYFRIVAIPSILISLMTIFGSILRAAGDTKTPMKVSLWVNIIHIPLDYVLIFGLAGFSGLGIAGAAWATVAVRAIGAVALYLYIRKSNVAFYLMARYVQRKRSHPCCKSHSQQQQKD